MQAEPDPSPQLDRTTDDVGRSLGIPAVSRVPWGTHLCQFYRTKRDLVGTLLPYFEHGLRNNEYCICITSDAREAAATAATMRAHLPGFDDALRSGQISFRAYRDWFRPDGRFERERVLAAWVDELAAARSKGYAGLRLSGNTFWLEPAVWPDFATYEAAVNEAIGEHRMVALCTYSLERCRASEILDVLMHHRFALIKRDDEWRLIEPSDAKQATEAVARMNLALTQRTAELQDALAQLRAALARLAAQSEERQRLAREVNDTIVQGLVASELSYDLDEQERARDLLRATSRQARQWVGQLLEDVDLRPGVARRLEPAEHPIGAR